MPNMPVQIMEKDLIYGRRVKVGGKFGQIIDNADKIKVKFDDGSFSFFERGQIEEVIEDSRLKGCKKIKVSKSTCPTCNSQGECVEKSDIFKCSNCGCMFAKDMMVNDSLKLKGGSNVKKRNEGV